MSDELKPQSIDTPEFAKLVVTYRMADSTEPELDHAYAALIAHIDAWGARLAGDAAQDAKRYRWLRDKARGEYEEQLFVTDDGHKDYYAPGGIYEHKLDAAVDLAMARKEPPCGS